MYVILCNVECVLTVCEDECIRGGGGTHVYMRLSLLFILFFVVPVDNDLLLLAANTFICSVQEEKSSPLRPAFCSAVCKRIPFAPMINN